MVAGIILLVAMIGAIVLTLHHGSDIQRQDIFAQVTTKIEEEVYRVSNK
jgi:NADH-quinone oxidoreductase subunit J